MNDRRLLLLVALGACAAPGGVGHAQAPVRVARVGWLTSVPQIASWPLLPLFTQGMRELGWIESRHYTIDSVSYEGRVDRLPVAAADLARRQPDLIIVSGILPTRAMMQATSTIPLVMLGVGDPVGEGFVSNLARPGGHITGLSSLDEGMLGKQFELLMQCAPRARRIGVVLNPDIPPHTRGLRDVEALAQRAGVQVRPVEFRSAGDLEAVVASLQRERVEAVHFFIQPFLNGGNHVERLAALALQQRWPTALGDRPHVRAGILVGYGWSVEDLVRRLPYYVDRILKGTPAGEVPVEQPTRFYTWVNLRSARALGLTLPRSLLLQADEVIE